MEIDSRSGQGSVTLALTSLAQLVESKDSAKAIECLRGPIARLLPTDFAQSLYAKAKQALPAPAAFKLGERFAELTPLIARFAGLLAEDAKLREQVTTDILAAVDKGLSSSHVRGVDTLACRSD